MLKHIYDLCIKKIVIWHMMYVCGHTGQLCRVSLLLPPFHGLHTALFLSVLLCPLKLTHKSVSIVS